MALDKPLYWDTAAGAPSPALVSYVASNGGGSAPDATTGTKGVVQLAGDLGGTAAAPTVPALASTPRFLKFDAGWPARPADERVTLFIGGNAVTDAPDDPNLTASDLWFPLP